MIRSINIPAAFDRIPEPWSPHIAARVNGHEVRLTKLDGAFDWHRHAGVEEAFFVVKGSFVMRFRDDEKEWDVAMGEGDFIVVPPDADHMPVADEECWVMLIEAPGELNTGDAVTARTRAVLPEL